MTPAWLLLFGVTICGYVFWDAHAREAHSHHHDPMHGYRIPHLFWILIGLCLITNAVLSTIGEYLIIEVNAVRGLLFLGVGTAMCTIGFVSLRSRSTAEALYALVARNADARHNTRILARMLMLLGFASIVAFAVFYAKYIFLF